jgi:hypothetical protein
MKKTALISAIFLVLFVFFGSPQARGQKEADKYEHWLKEEVKLLITPEQQL